MRSDWVIKESYGEADSATDDGTIIAGRTNLLLRDVKRSIENDPRHRLLTRWRRRRALVRQVVLRFWQDLPQREVRHVDRLTGLDDTPPPFVDR